MSLSPQTEERLAHAAKSEAQYVPNHGVSRKLHDKSLIMLVGPAAIGKSYVMNHIVTTDSDFRRVPVFSTRDPRPDDEPGMFRLQAHDDASVNKILNMIETGEVVQYAVHPTSGRIYGTTAEDFSGTFNLLATLSNVVEPMRNLPFANTHVIGLAATPELWQERFNQRYPKHNDARAKRRQEAISSLEWLLAPERNSIVTWVKNDDLSLAVKTIIDSVKYNDRGNPDAAGLARQMLEIAKRNL